MANRNAAIASLNELTTLGEAYKQGTSGSREGLMGAASKLLSQLMLPAESMLFLQWAQPTHQAVLRLSLDIHLFEALAANDGSPKTSAEIATATKPRADPNLVARMLRHLAAMGTILETDIDTFAPTALSRNLTDERFRDTIYFIADDFQPVHQSAPAFFAKTGYRAPKSSTDGLWQYAYDCPGEGYFETFARVPRMGKRFAGMMDLWSQDRTKWFEPGYYPVRERLVEGARKGDEETFLVDVGAGSGHDLEQLMEALGIGGLPSKLVLQDRPEIVELSKVDQRIERMGHDFLTEQPVKGRPSCCLSSQNLADLIM